MHRNEVLGTAPGRVKEIDLDVGDKNPAAAALPTKLEFKFERYQPALVSGMTHLTKITDERMPYTRPGAVSFRFQCRISLTH